jgi:hypothetical protein
MNCFRHPDEVAVVYCKGCDKPLCLDCSEQTFGNETHVCSEGCAETASTEEAGQPLDADEVPDSLFNRIFAKVFITALVIIIGGLIGGYIFSFRAELAIDRIEHPPPLYGYESDLVGYHDPRSSIFRIFYDLGITDWRALFGIGAILGIGCLVLYFKAGKKITIATILLIGLILQAWVLWT